jgi:hypothetical protein
MDKNKRVMCFFFKDVEINVILKDFLFSLICEAIYKIIVNKMFLIVPLLIL